MIWSSLRDAVDGGVTAVVLSAVGEGEPPAGLLEHLTADERARAARFRFAADRAIYVVAHSLLARAMAAVLGPNGPAWSLEAEREGGKPALRIEGQALYVNLSHTRGAAAVAITRSGEVGIDVEAERPLPDLHQLAARVFTPNERRALQDMADPRRLFVRLWARKEAVIKACGLGLAAPLQEIDVLHPLALRLPAELPRLAVADVAWPAQPQVAVALCGPRSEHRVFEVMAGSG
jgi:4'-phosphopantetheinyl transferase